MSSFIDLTDMRFGKLVVLRRLENYVSRSGNTYSMWECRCDCGNLTKTRGDNLRSGTAASCRCLSAERFRKKRQDPETVAKKILIRHYQQGASARGLVFTLTDEEFLSLSRSNCLYCGLHPTNQIGAGRGCSIEWKKMTTRFYQGVDRVFNSDGYTCQNSVPCCGMCNRAKHKYPLFWWYYYLSETRPERIEFVRTELSRVCGPDWEQRMLDEWKQHQEKEQAS